MNPGHILADFEPKIVHKEYDLRCSSELSHRLLFLDSSQFSWIWMRPFAKQMSSQEPEGRNQQNTLLSLMPLSLWVNEKKYKFKMFLEVFLDEDCLPWRTGCHESRWRRSRWGKLKLSNNFWTLRGHFFFKHICEIIWGHQNERGEVKWGFGPPSEGWKTDSGKQKLKKEYRLATEYGNKSSKKRGGDEALLRHLRGMATKGKRSFTLQSSGYP